MRYEEKNDKLELILLGVGILLLLLLFVVKRRLDAPEETATAESRTETMKQKAGGDDTEHGTGKRGFSEQ